MPKKLRLSPTQAAKIIADADNSKIRGAQRSAQIQINDASAIVVTEEYWKKYIQINPEDHAEVFFSSQGVVVLDAAQVEKSAIKKRFTQEQARELIACDAQPKHKSVAQVKIAELGDLFEGVAFEDYAAFSKYSGKQKAIIELDREELNKDRARAAKGRNKKREYSAVPGDMTRRIAGGYKNTKEWLRVFLGKMEDLYADAAAAAQVLGLGDDVTEKYLNDSKDPQARVELLIEAGIAKQALCEYNLSERDVVEAVQRILGDIPKNQINGAKVCRHIDFKTKQLSADIN